MVSRYLRDLEQRRDEIRNRIQELNVELNHLNAIIQRQAIAVAMKGDGRPITRKNFRAIEIAGLIRQMLLEQIRENSGQGLKTREIYNKLARDHVGLKYASFRSYLHRLKKEGMIYNNRHGGPWHLVEFKEKLH